MVNSITTRTGLIFCLILLLLTVPSFQAQVASEHDLVVQSLKTLITEQCRTFEIKYPIETRALHKRESRAYVEQALENALNQYLPLVAKSGVLI